ncbi:MAG: hypothetical protein ACREVR_03385 [Burkholderiales bacterium]
MRVAKGEPESFVSAAELRSKFDGLAAPYLSERRRGELARALAALGQAKDVGAVLQLTRADQTGARRLASAG